MKRFFLVLLMSFALAVTACSAFAASGDPDPYWRPGAEEYWIRVNKQRLTLTLYKGVKPVHTYPVAIGIGKGEVKTSRLDKITPQGSYKIWRVIEDATGVIYDPKWFGEPGEAKPGSYGAKLISFYNRWQIAIHGTNAPWTIGRRASHGCIRLRNKDITELCTYIKPPMHLEIIEGTKTAAFQGCNLVQERALYKETI